MNSFKMAKQRRRLTYAQNASVQGEGNSYPFQTAARRRWSTFLDSMVSFGKHFPKSSP